jgi:hypothetical protein
MPFPCVGRGVKEGVSCGTLILLVVGVLVAGVLAVCSSTQARAGDNGAEVVRDDGDCFVADSTGSWLFSFKIQFVIQPDGTINHHITGSVIPEKSSPLPSRPVTDFTGQPCFVLDGVVLTRITAGIVTPSGQVKLTCRS